MIPDDEAIVGGGNGGVIDGQHAAVEVAGVGIVEAHGRIDRRERIVLGVVQLAAVQTDHGRQVPVNEDVVDPDPFVSSRACNVVRVGGDDADLDELLLVCRGGQGRGHRCRLGRSARGGIAHEPCWNVDVVDDAVIAVGGEHAVRAHAILQRELRDGTASARIDVDEVVVDGDVAGAHGIERDLQVRSLIGAVAGQRHDFIGNPVELGDSDIRCERVRVVLIR